MKKQNKLMFQKMSFSGKNLFLVISLITLIFLEWHEFIAFVSAFPGEVFWWDSLSNLLSTLVGVILGIPVALFLTALQEMRTEKEKKEKLLKSLYNELDFSKIELDRMVDREIIKLESGVLSSLLRSEIWHAYSDGGELEWIKDVALLARIADSYYSIRSVSNLADRYYDSVQYATGDASPRRIYEVLDTLSEAIEYSRTSVTRTMKMIKDLVSDVESLPP